LGIIAMFGSMILLIILPLYKGRTPIVTTTINSIHSVLTILFALNFVFLGWIGANPAEAPYVTLGQCSTVIYIVILILLLILNTQEWRMKSPQFRNAN
jgi:ubiquinol-cytochrome c reductase cytochrome b subunit